MGSKSNKLVDVKGIFKSKNPKLLKWLPKPILEYIRRIVHEDEVNEFFEKYDHLDPVDFAEEVLQKFNIKTAVKGIEHVPAEGGVFLAMNHPLGGMDAMAMIKELSKVRTDFKFVVNDILLYLENLRSLFVGVNKHGSNTKEALEQLNQLYASDHAVLVFPSGLVSRKRGEEVEDLEWKKTFVTRARVNQRDVIPVYIDGSLSSFFYRLDNWRSKLGVKANLEMFYLVDELFKQENRTITLCFGQPIPYKTFDRSKSDPEWAQWVKKEVYKLRDQYLKNNNE